MCPVCQETKVCEDCINVELMMMSGEEEYIDTPKINISSGEDVLLEYN